MRIGSVEELREILERGSTPPFTPVEGRDLIIEEVRSNERVEYLVPAEIWMAEGSPLWPPRDLY